MIKIQNLYYMLSYAFQILEQEMYKNLAIEKFENALDLFSAILSKGIASQVKRGLNREYISRTGALTCPSGKINVSDSLKQNNLLKKQLVCIYDEYTENNDMNKILKTTSSLLIRCPDVSKEQKKALKKSMIFLNHVDDINLQKISWTQLTYHRNNMTYKMLMNICYLIIEGMLMTEKEGVYKLARFVDSRQMHRIFEKFVLGYYRRHFPMLHPSPAVIDWDAEGENIELLPSMKTDITLSRKNKTIIIDTKYYERTMQTNYLFNKRTFHSHNMYQIFTYVKNMDYTNSGNVMGLLLYAKTEEELVPDNDYIICGNRISVKTLDLNTHFDEIKRQLDRIAADFFGEDILERKQK